MAISINCDMGESFGLYHMGDDVGMMPLITVANVACGFHASDPSVMRETVRLAKENGVSVGAHPSLPDLQGFGRREMKLDPEELFALLVYQVGALKGFLDIEGMPLNHIKPHGALYGMSARMEECATAIARVAEHYGVPVFGLAGTLHEEVYKSRKIEFVSEFYADLQYDQNGMLIITRKHGAVDVPTAVDRVSRAIKEGKVKSVEGPDIPVAAGSICVHSDTPAAVELAAGVHRVVTEWNQSN